MGVVRREGDWRLEKREDGVYAITHQHNLQLKVFTPEYTPGTLDAPMIDASPVREVDSYSEAEGLFEEMAHGDRPGGMTTGGGDDPILVDDGIGGLDLGPDIGGSEKNQDGSGENLPPGGFAIVLLLVGGIVLNTSGFAPGSTVFLIGAVFVAGGVAILGWAAVLFRMQGPDEAIAFLVTSTEDSSSTQRRDEQEKTPPTPETLKDELIFDRAGQKCEWCEQRFDHPEVHHIEPRREGGPNEPGNLIVLCPNCHEKADREAIPRSKLQAKIRRIVRGPS